VVSEAARQLCQEAELVDLHVETFLPVRLFGYDIRRRHRWNPGWLFGHLDLPRAKEAGVNGGMWSITTQPFRSAEGRWRALQRNVERLRAVAEAAGGRFVRTATEYQRARRDGRHPMLLSLQGANAIDAAPNGVSDLPPDVVRMNLLHLTPSRIGAPSGAGAWVSRRRGLTEYGRRLVEQMNARRVFVDLAHIHRDGFRDAVDAHDRTLPFLVSHAGIEGVYRHWRNLDDDEIRAVARSGGVVGVITAGLYLGRRRGASGAERFVDHLEHLIRVGGEDVAGIGTDFDGFIVPVRGLRGAHAYPRIVDAMLRRGFEERVIRKVMGGNFLRVLACVRP
jgi:membrane dipeptidase